MYSPGVIVHISIAARDSADEPFAFPNWKRGEPPELVYGLNEAIGRAVTECAKHSKTVIASQGSLPVAVRASQKELSFKCDVPLCALKEDHVHCPQCGRADTCEHDEASDV